jgi:DNA-binding transcriptional MerR regulator
MTTTASLQTLVSLRPPGDSDNGPEPRLLTIGQIARRSGFTIKALRFYDRCAVLPPAVRRPSGYRFYSEADLHRLEFIRQAKALGLSLGAIRGFVTAARGPGHPRVREHLARMLGERIAQTDRVIATLRQLRRELQRRRRSVLLRQHGKRARGYCSCLHGTQEVSIPGRQRRRRDGTNRTPRPA